MTAYQILTIEDDAAIRRGIVAALQASGYVVWQAARFDEAVTMAMDKPCDLVLLDLVMPGGDGLDVLAHIRRDKPTLPVIILTARGESIDRVRGLRLGADDYVVKPFSVDELLARVEAVLRRSPARSAQTIRLNIPSASIDWSTKELTSDEGTCEVLSDRESALLEYLARRSGRVIDRNELLRGVWQLEAKGITTRTMDVHVARLREKLRRVCGDIPIIKTVRGRGYVFDQRWVDAT
ncbi:Phosphate regulon transcriptional regulatory protein PhoB [Rubripirellula lacrimiformis]|uniref:Phosphate regulon transcriptional regulatory protein PhoB n=1 Tax=Rubripirellula lacrimiformis TaxID=1930273 RepID=A0A517N768_9BACT|nr:response regulator transcription factor [Rubripirellula lacrimiformis]QDT02997.1 Phosphate regulon transcriptional regulatory protein PhoB [Rubripirellula lacrimiformis]